MALQVAGKKLKKNDFEWLKPGHYSLEDESESEADMILTKDMINDSNRFLAVEGVDCTGKGSITQLIEKKGLGIDGVKVKRVDFPQYDLPSGAMIKAYLNGQYGNYARFLSSVPGENAVDWHAIAMGRSERLLKDIRFVMNLYAMNRIEYFRTAELEPDTVYVFDRFSYSNIIHHISALYAFYDYGAGNELMQIHWRSNPICKEISFSEYKDHRFWNMLSSECERIYEYEKYNDVPLPYTFLLLLDEHHILERLEKRKETKHEGEDILERRDAIHRACEFLAPRNSEFHSDNGVVLMPVAAFGYDNDNIADSIIELYKTAVFNEIQPGCFAEYFEDEDDEEDDEE